MGLTAGTVNVATPATASTAQVTLTGQPVAGDQVDVDGQTYTFQTAVAAAGDIKIGANTAATALNLAHAINDVGGTSGVGNDYLAVGGAANTHASATVLGNTVTLTALTTGTGGNAYTLTTPTDTSGFLTISGATFTGGAAAANTPTAVNNDLSTAADAQATLSLINTAIASVAATRGTIGANINRLQAASAVITNQTQNLTSAEDTITAADIPSVVANLSRFTILNQSGISALAQANSAQQSILKLLQ